MTDFRIHSHILKQYAILSIKSSHPNFKSHCECEHTLIDLSNDVHIIIFYITNST